MMDLDINAGGTTRTTLLHWLAYNIDLTTTPATVPADTGAAYWQPSPPAGDIAHTYAIVLFMQPDNFALPAQYTDFSTTDERQGFDLNTFATAAGLTNPLAANYIQVQNGTSTAAATVTTAPVTATSGTMQVTSIVPSGKPSPSLTSHAAAPTQFAIEWGILAGAGLIAAIV
jgi:phosphatidylethanolamine-binding protein